MNAFRSLPRIAVAVWFASFAVAAMAVDKHYSMLVQANPSFDANGVVIVPVPMTLILKNESPPGTANSNIGSFIVQAIGATIVPGSVTCQAGTCSGSGNTLTVKKIAALQAQETLEVDFTTTTCGDAHWFATVYNGSQLSGQTFSPTDDPGFAVFPEDQITNVSCGTADCTGSTFIVSDSTSPATTSLKYVTGFRSPVNKDGSSACTSVDFFVSNFLSSASNSSTDGRLHFRWPLSLAGGQPAAVFRYTVNLPTSTAMVAWLNTDGTVASGFDPTDPNTVDPYPIPAPACLTSLAPAPYAQLGTAITQDATTINVVNSIPNGQLPTRPFPAVIGSERISVLATSGNGTWTVARGQGGTAKAAHNQFDPVMSTPLPILGAPVGPYQTSDGQAVQAQMCIIGTPVKNKGNTWTATFFDIGDGWTGIR